MSFITKRERVFNEYEMFDLPARNEGKLKAYASCTDARAWSHFCSDKSEHLVEIIKRNNETVRPKYLPTNVIVDTLMAAKNNEIARLKQKIGEFEQMLAAYDQLELTCEQKCEIAEAHAAIRAANKELEDMYLDLDLSGFTEALDSEAFETGKSKGDGEEIMTQTFEEEKQQPPSPKKASKSVQIEKNVTLDATTCAVDPRIEEMQDIIIIKDAKLNAMNNSMAVMENHVCEPYCIYAHIYTALEMIYSTLCQNEKYKQFLNLMVAGKDTRCIDIKGKILYKLKVLEKFSNAIIAPCNEEFNKPKVIKANNECPCYRAELESRIEPSCTMTSAESAQPNIDNKRAHMVADIIRNEEMKDILSKDSILNKQDSDIMNDGYILCHDYNVDNENLERLKKLQENFDDLMICYESLKHEKNCLEMRCQEYEELEKEFENLKLQIKEYNSLWNEKEHYRKRSTALDTLKEQYFILTDETANLETQLKAVTEINLIKCMAIDELRNENVGLEKKMNEALIAFEKEKNSLLCKLKEADCTILCQGQQIKTLMVQIDRLFEQEQQNRYPSETEQESIMLIDEVETHKDQIQNLKEALFCNEDEKQNLQQQYQDQIKLINDLKNDVEKYKSAYEKSLQRNDYLEKYTNSLIEKNNQDNKEKEMAVENLLNMINTKSQIINELMTETGNTKTENSQLLKQIEEMQNIFNNSVVSLENEKSEAFKSLQLSRRESQELLEKVKDYDHVKHLQADVSKSLEMHIENKKELEVILTKAIEENNNLKENLAAREKNSSMLLQEIHNLREINTSAVNNINSLLDENSQYKTSIELTQKESGELRNKLNDYENLSLQLHNLQITHKKLVEENNRLKNELENALVFIQLTKRESYELIGKLQHSESTKDELSQLKESYQKLVIEKNDVQNELSEKNKDMEKLLQIFNDKLHVNEHLMDKCSQVDKIKEELQDFQKAYDQILSEKQQLENDMNNGKREFEKLYDMLEKKIEENRELGEQIKYLQINEIAAKSSIKSLQDDNLATKATLKAVKKESTELVDKIKQYEELEMQFKQLKSAHDEMRTEKDKLQSELVMQLNDLKRIERENFELQCHSQTLNKHSEELMRQELVTQKKIRDLRDKLDESENIISNLSEDVLSRDHRIAILENHINELEDEVRKLHTSLAEVIDTGEQMKDLGFLKIDSIKNMEAHHSKATHNMKMELAKLQNQNTNLEEQLSVTKIKSEESSKDIIKHQYQIRNLKNEREIIVTEIKQLELKSVGDSNLAPDNCDVENVLLSLDRIRKSLDSSTSKSASLEQTILKVQTSSQLLLSKADEAKKLVEKEKQKIISEKEDAIRDRQIMEEQLLDLKEKLENQIANNKIVEDLEATITNQKLIINKINQSTQEYIDKLNKKLETLQNSYQNSMTTISELQEKLQRETEEKNIQLHLLEKLKENFNVKANEVSELQRQLDDLKNKPTVTVDTQTKTKDTHRNAETQIDRNLLSNKVEICYEDTNSLIEDKENTDKLDPEITDIFGFRKSTHRKLHSEIQQKPEQMPINEVQILTANIEPTFDYVRNSYMNYKITRLSFGKLEKYSISCSSDNDVYDNLISQTSENEEYYSNPLNRDPNLVDIYNRHSVYTNSSKENYGSENLLDKKETQKNINKSPEFGATDTNININHVRNKSTDRSIPDKDLFVIYKDNQASYNNTEQTQGPWSEVIVETVAVYSKKAIEHVNKLDADRDTYFYPEKKEKANDEKSKLKLKIEMPLIRNESNSLIAISDRDKKSLHSYSVTSYGMPKRFSASDTKINDDENGRSIKNSYPSLPTLFNEILKPNVNEASGTSKPTDHPIIRSPNNDKESKNKLSRVEANVLLLNNENSVRPIESTAKPKIGQRYSPDYIPNNIHGNVASPKSKYSTKRIRTTKSDEMFNIVKEKEDNINHSFSRSSYLNMIPSEYKRTSPPSKSSNKSQKTFTEQSILVKLDKDSDYEKTINNLTKALETIEKDYKKKIEAIKVQYDSNIKSIIIEHNQGVKTIQGLHEDTLQDITKIHENEVENWRSMSIEAMRKADKLENENRLLKTKVQDPEKVCINECPVKALGGEQRKRPKCRKDTKLLTKTTVEAFNVKPIVRAQGPCTCPLDVNISDTIRNIFEQVDVEQRKMAEHAYIKFIANKMMSENIESLDAQELSFLHIKVCRTWKTKLSKEEALRKKIECLESELLNKQRNAQQHFVELDRKVAEERRRLQEVREAVCRSGPGQPRPAISPDTGTSSVPRSTDSPTIDMSWCPCNGEACNMEVSVRGSAGDLVPFSASTRSRRNNTTRNDNNTVDVEERREKKIYNDEPPTRLRRSHDRQLRNKK